jgi:hypothetical protein
VRLYSRLHINPDRAIYPDTDNSPSTDEDACRQECSKGPFDGTVACNGSRVIACVCARAPTGFTECVARHELINTGQYQCVWDEQSQSWRAVRQRGAANRYCNERDAYDAAAQCAASTNCFQSISISSWCQCEATKAGLFVNWSCMRDFYNEQCINRTSPTKRQVADKRAACSQSSLGAEQFVREQLCGN